MKCLICGNEIPENEIECPTCTSFIDTLIFLTFSHFDEAKLPKLLEIPGLMTHIYKILNMGYEDFRVNLDSLSKKGFELINLEKDKEIKNVARNFFQFFIDFMNSREGRVIFQRGVVNAKGVEILRDYVKSELEIISEINSQKISKADELIRQNYSSAAVKILKNQAEFLKSIGKHEIGELILTKSLDVLLEDLEFEEFFETFNHLSGDIKKRYLTRIFPKYIQKLEELINIDNKLRSEKIFENSIRIYREQMLYVQSNEINSIFD